MKHSDKAARISLGLVVCLLIIAGARLAMAPVFVYWPGSESGKPVYTHPREGARQLVGGPYYQLQAGSYRAAFRVRSDAQKLNSPLATLRVVLYNSAGTTVVSRDVISAAGNRDRYREEEIAFRLPVASVIETQVFYAGVAPFWIDGIRIWPDRLGATNAPLASALAAAGVLLLVYGLAFRKPRVAHAWPVLLARSCFMISAVALIAGAGRGGALSPLGGSWLLPPYLWVAAPLVGGGLVLMFAQWLSGTLDPLIGIADAISDGIVIAVLIWDHAQLNFFSLAAIAMSAWICKLALMVFALARFRGERAVLAAMAIAAYAFVGLLPWYHHYSTSGDETSYLVETLSLLRHRSVNTWKVLESGEYREFAGSADKGGMEADTITVGGVPGFPSRDLGPSVFALPAYLAGGSDGVRLGMELVAVALAGVVFALIRNLGISQGACVLAWAGTCFSLPILYYSSMLYPELPGAALTAVGLLLLDRPLTPRYGLLMGLCLGLLPAMNARYWILAGSLGILCLARILEAKRWSLLPFLAIPLLAIVTAEVCLNRAVYGIPIPNAGYYLVLHGANAAIYNQATPFAHNFVKGWLGLWLDRYWGAFAGAPVLLLALAGVPVLWLRSRRVALRVLVLFVPYFIAVASTTFWPGAAVPPRYLVPVLPLLALPFAALVDNRFRAVAVALIALGALITIASLSSFDPSHAVARLAARCADSFGFTLASCLPSVAVPGSYGGAIAFSLLWGGAGLWMAVLGCKSQFSRVQRSKAGSAGADIEIAEVKWLARVTVTLCLGICVCFLITRRAASDSVVKLSPTAGLDRELTSFRETLTSNMTRLDLHPGQEIKIPIRIVNPGPETWVSAGRFPVTISYKWFQHSEMLPMEGERTQLPGALGPKQSVDLDIRVIAPNHPGDFAIRISLVQEAVAWFMSKSGTFLQLNASVR